MKRLIIPIAIVLMMVFIAAAYMWDSVRAAAAARQRVDLADQEMAKHEQRLLKLLAEHPKSTPEVKAAVESFQSANTMQKRRDAYEQIVANFKSTMASDIDATDPLERKFMDDIAGSMNRRDIAQKQFDEEVVAYQRFLSGFRGRLARLVSPVTYADWESAQ